MNRFTACAPPMVALALVSLLWLSSLAPARAASVTDTFPLTVTGTERCRNDPKFVEPIHVKTKSGETITFKRDVLNTGDLTDIQATINTNGGNATIDAITLNGRAFPVNKSGSLVQFVLSGTDPGNPDHFLTLRGQATFNKAGTLTKVTGSYVYQILSGSGGVQDVDCFGSGTFGAQKPPSSGGSGGTLTVANAPASVRGTFVAAKRVVATVSGGFAAIAWAEVNPSMLGHAEVMTMSVDTTTGQVIDVIFSMADGSVGTAWGCSTVLPSGCAGASVNRTAGTFTVVDTVLTDTTDSSPPPPITVNGTLTFTPF